MTETNIPMKRNVNVIIQRFDPANDTATVNVSFPELGNTESIGVGLNVVVKGAKNLERSETVKQARHLVRDVFKTISKDALVRSFFNNAPGMWILNGKTTELVNSFNIILSQYEVSGDPTNNQTLDVLLDKATAKLREIAEWLDDPVEKDAKST